VSHEGVLVDEVETIWQPLAIEDREKSGDVFIEVAFAGGREEVGLADHIPFSDVTSLITDVSRKIGDSLKVCSPSKATVEIGLEFGLQEGRLVGLIARGSSKANLKITLEWSQTQAAS